jgi:hypothetical protein
MIFLDMLRSVYCSYLEGQNTISSCCYSDLVMNKVKPLLPHRHPVLHVEGVALLEVMPVLIARN